ncbi:hypothetical protein OHB26_34995 [Nocardia sp. NBC_01503]|uniref:hypothetical protein n=1 Tax=Nocardia sp. NBC_01503 TaxID=2975997 RepID=UPI002E7BEB0C|nr:hypothetical protein [Nocardia sp. NBC_01503]WTL32048.1 hypothetical protein OHB26_34995 [Nocardia sp. NBC_01503]
MTINRFTATAVLAIGATVLTGGIAAAEPEVDPGPGISVQQADPVEDPDATMHQCNALLGALVGAAIGGTGSALPGALIGAAIGAAIGWSLLYPPGPPLACWQPAPNP